MVHAALAQVNAAAKAVHAPVMDPTGRALDPAGDVQLRGSYSAHMADLMRRAGARPVRDIVDLGCATGDALPVKDIIGHGSKSCTHAWQSLSFSIDILRGSV